MGEIKTLKVQVELEIRAEVDDDEAVRREIVEALKEAVETDEFEYTTEEIED